MEAALVETVGLDPMVGAPRFTFNVVQLQSGVSFLPALEEHLRMSLIISEGNPSIFITHPISLIFIIVAVVSFFLPLVRRKTGTAA